MQQLFVKKDNSLPDQQEWDPILGQKDSEPPNIKEEQEELWSEDEEKPQSSQLHQRQRHESTEVEILTNNSTEPRTLKVEANGKDCSGSQPASSSGPHTNDMFQQLVIKEEMLPKQQELNLSVDQDLKLEQEELWTNNEGQQLHWLEAEKTRLPFAHIPVKSENDDEKPQSSQVLQKSDMQMLLTKEEILPEQQERNWSVDQEDIKEEQDKLWISLQVQQLHQLEEADIVNIPFTAVPVTSENDKKTQSSQVHQSQSDEIPEAEPVASSSPVHRTLTAQADGEDDGGPQSGSCSHLQPDTYGKSSDCSETDSYKEKETNKFSSGFNSLINGNVSLSHSRCNMNKKKYNHSEYGKSCAYMNYLKQQKRRQGSEKPLSCSECGQRFGHKNSLVRHMRIHTGQKPFSCSECGTRFGHKSSLIRHMTMHTGQKPFSCSECGQRFWRDSSLTTHMRIHTGQKLFSCSECGKRFGEKTHLITHMRIHTGQKPFSCSECGTIFGYESSLNRHMRMHTGQKPFSCSECAKTFWRESSLIRHMRMHTGQKPFSCSECGKRFGEKTHLITHMRIHTGQKPFSCSECGKRFGERGNMIRHMRIHSP